MGTREQWQTVMKPAFLNDIVKLSAKEVRQVMEKISMLAADPLPDGMVKKQLTHVPGRPYRIRSGKYRIFYTFNNEVVSIYKLDERGDDTYSDTVAPDAPLSARVLAGLDVPVEEDALDDVDQEAAPEQPDWEHIFGESKCRKLPEPVTGKILHKLSVPSMYHARLLRVQDEDELLACPGVDEEYLLKIHDYMFERTLPQVMQEPNLLLNDVDDLLRFKEGELLTFLLQLSPEQERYASWSQRVNGPTLVKGGPGTGKSTVALYRIRSLLTHFLQEGQSPRLLFTTYTNALIKSSQQLLMQLLGPSVSHVEVRTADMIAHFILEERKQHNSYAIISAEDLYTLTRKAIAEAQFNGNILRQHAQKQALERMGLDYLVQELNTVLVARHITSLEAYQQATRTGRKVGLNAIQRSAVWQVYERWRALLREQGMETWQQRRVRADALADSSSLAHAFDAVIIDEAQDLDPSALHMLVTLCKAPNRLLITADANQSIYGSGFSWSDVHESLRFPGRTRVLDANYRSTAEIGEATRSYLTRGALEPEGSRPRYMNNGPLPAARTVRNREDEVQLLINYFKKASRSLRHTMGSCAVLCPNESAGRKLETALRDQRLEATFMKGIDLNLAQPGIKIMTLKSSKGLEFPIVALAGFTPHKYPPLPKDATPEEREELLAGERRTMYVGMTRAMRALLVVIPAGTTTPLLRDFDPTLWNLKNAL